MSRYLHEIVRVTAIITVGGHLFCCHEVRVASENARREKNRERIRVIFVLPTKIGKSIYRNLTAVEPRFGGFRKS